MSGLPRYQPGWRTTNGTDLNTAFDLVNGVNPFGRISASTATASDAWHGQLVIFTQACTVTIPVGLRPDFSCGWSQEGSGIITFAAGSSATMQSLSNLTHSAGQYSDGGIYAVPVSGASTATIYRLYGALG